MVINITFVICTMRGGGAERVVSVLANHLIKNKKYKINIVTTSGDILDYELDQDINYIPISTKCNLIGLKQLERVLNINSTIKEIKSDVIISFLPTASIYASICKIFKKTNKLIISERMDPNQDPKSFLLRGIRDFFYKFGDGFIFQTDDAKKYFSNKIQYKSKIIFNPLKEDLPIGINEKKNLKIVTALRLEEQKNVKMLINAFEIFVKKSPKYFLEIYGEGSLEEELKEYVKLKELSDKIIFKGFKKDLHGCLLDAQFFVLPSNYEGLSNSMIEAMAIGLPVISTDHPIGGARLFIKNGKNGFLVPVGDHEKLAEKMLFMAQNPEKIKEMSINSLEIRRKLEPKKIFLEWEKFIGEILND